jgi:hypothetical protein
MIALSAITLYLFAEADSRFRLAQVSKSKAIAL